MTFLLQAAKDFFGIEEGPFFSHAEIARHHARDTLWIVADNKVYDVTQFVNQHPGGPETLMKRGGGQPDCTRDLHFHSSKAQGLWKTFGIGSVVAEKNQETDEAGRIYLRSRGFIPVEEMEKSDVSSRCASGVVRKACTFHFSDKDRDALIPTSPTSTTSSSSSSSSSSGDINKGGGCTAAAASAFPSTTSTSSTSATSASS